MTSNANRSAEMKERLLESTAGCLIELGYAQTSNRNISERAGVSNGALLHHFQNREDLMVAVMRWLYVQFFHQIAIETAKLESKSDPVDNAVDVLWASMQSEKFKAILELYLAAANDEELAARIRPVMRQLASSLDEVMEPFLPEIPADSEYFQDVTDLLFYTVEGMGLNGVAFGADDIAQRVRPLLKVVLRAAVAGRKSFVSM